MNKENRLIYFSGGSKEVPPTAPSGPKASPETALEVFKRSNLGATQEDIDSLQTLIHAKPAERDLNAEAANLITKLEQSKIKIENATATNISDLNTAISSLSEQTVVLAKRYEDAEPAPAAAGERESVPDAIAKARETKEKNAKSAIELGWGKSGEVDDYANETISFHPLAMIPSPGVGMLTEYLNITPEFLASSLNKTRHLYSGVLSGIEITGEDTDELTESVNEIMNAETRTDRTLDATHITETLKEAGVSIKNKELDRPEFTRIKGYVLGLLYGAKKSLSPDQFREYKKALEEKINKKLVRSLAATYNKKADEWFSFAGAGVEEAMKKAINALPTPDEWLAMKEAEEAPATPKAKKESAQKAGGAAGKATPRGKKAPSKGREHARERVIDKKITAATNRANKKLMERWKALETKREKDTKNLIEQDIKNALGYGPEDAPDYGGKEFAEKVQAFQKSQGLDMQDGIIGDQTMTAILDMAKEKTKDEEEKAKFESYFTGGKVKRREAQYYSLHGAARHGGGRKRPAAAPPASEPATPAAPAEAAPAAGREPTVAAAPAEPAAPTAAPAAAPAEKAEAKETLEPCGKYCKIVKDVFSRRGERESVRTTVDRITQRLASELYFDLHDDYVHISPEALKNLVYNRLEVSNDYLLVGMEKGFAVNDLAQKLGAKIEAEYIPQAKKRIEEYHLGIKKPTMKEIQGAVNNAFEGSTPEAKLGRLYNWMRKTLKDIKPKYMPSLDDQALLSRYVTDKDQEKAKSSIATILEQEINNVAREEAKKRFEEEIGKNRFV